MPRSRAQDAMHGRGTELAQLPALESNALQAGFQPRLHCVLICAGGDPQLWHDALEYFAAQPDDCSTQVKSRRAAGASTRAGAVARTRRLHLLFSPSVVRWPCLLAPLA